MSLTFVDSKTRCASTNCQKTQISKFCTLKFCAPCCRAQGSSCGFTSHDEARATQQATHTAAAQARAGATLGTNPFLPTRPKPSQPPSAPAVPPSQADPLTQLPVPVFIAYAAPQAQPVPACPASIPVSMQTPPLEPPRASTASSFPSMTQNTVPQRHLQAPIDNEWLAQWRRDSAQQVARLQDVERQRANEQALAKSFEIECWDCVSMVSL